MVLLWFWSLASQKHWFYYAFSSLDRKTIGFTVIPEPCIKKALVCIAFLQHGSGANANTRMFTVLLEPWIKKALVFMWFEQLWSGANAQTIATNTNHKKPLQQICLGVPMMLLAFLRLVFGRIVGTAFVRLMW